MTTTFETATCTRCGGSGRYSFNMMTGDRCFGCGGKGVKLTKRGAAARAFYDESMKTPVEELKVGMYLLDDTYGFATKFLPVLSVKQGESYQIVGDKRIYHIYVETRRSVLGVFPGSKVRAVRDEAHRQELLAAAQAYQATLTKLGKPAKQKKAA